MLEAKPSPVSTGDSDSHAPRWLLDTRVRLGLSLASLAVLIVVLIQWARGLYSDAHSIAGRYDFSTYYAAAYALRHHLHANIYSQVVLTQAGAAGQVMIQPPLAYTYPPLFALLLSPFTLLSFRVLSKLWLFGNAALWLAITVLLAYEIAVLLRPALRERPADASAPRGVPPQEPRPARAENISLPAGMRVRALLDDPLPLVAVAPAAWLCLGFVPAVQTLLTGQINFLVLAPLALVPLLLRRGHDRWAGAAIGVAAILKFTPAVLVVYLLLRRRWQAAAAAAITFAGLFVLSALAVGPGVAAASITQALHVGSGDAILGHNQALFAPLLLFAGQHAPAQLASATLLARLGLVLLAVVLGYLIWRLPESSSPPGQVGHVPPLHPPGDGVTDDSIDTHGIRTLPGERELRDAPRESSPGDSHPASARSFGAHDAAAYGLALCGLLLLSPTDWVHHYAWLLPAAAIALGLALARLAGAFGTRHLPGAIVALAVVVAACAALSASLPYDWDTNPHPAITHAGLFVWPLALLLRPLAALVLAGMLAILGQSPGAGGRLAKARHASHQHPLAPRSRGEVGG